MKHGKEPWTSKKHPIIDLEVEVYGVAVKDLTECSS